MNIKHITTNLFLIACMIHSFNGQCKQPQPKSVWQSPDASGLTLHTLSIHIKDPAVHDSVFLFLKEQLQLPVYYHPTTLGERKYAGIYAGNLVLEPCGPYTQFSYVTDFRAIFFGLNFETDSSISSVAKVLDSYHVKYKIDGDEYIYPQDPDLVGENTFMGISNRRNKLRDHARQDSLRSVIAMNSQQGLGIEYIQEVRVGYSNDIQLQKWEAFISPSSIDSENLWKVGNGLTIRFVPSAIKEVKGIVFKVHSLEGAKQYLINKHVTFTTTKEEIILEPSEAFGLSISFSQQH